MAKQWDGTMKWLVGEAPQDFVSWLGQGSSFVSELSPHLGARSIDADLLYRALYEDHVYLLHIEFQKRSVKNMAMRMCEYNMLATRKYELPVHSVVIYLRKDRPIVESPYVHTLPWGEESIRFNYRSIKLWEVPTEAILRSGNHGLLPLVPLTSEGSNYKSIERVIALLEPVEGQPKVGALSLTYALASLVYTGEDDSAWLKRSFVMLGDILDDILKESWVYKEWTQEANKQGKKEGLERQEGRPQAGQEGRPQAGQEGRSQASAHGYGANSFCFARAVSKRAECAIEDTRGVAIAFYPAHAGAG